MRGIHRWPVNSPHKGPVSRKCFHLMTSSWQQCCVHILWDMRFITTKTAHDPQIYSHLHGIQAHRNGKVDIWRHWLHWKLLVSQLPVQPAMNFFSKWNFRLVGSQSHLLLESNRRNYPFFIFMVSFVKSLIIYDVSQIWLSAMMPFFINL